MVGEGALTSALSRRRLLAGLLLAPPVLAGCSLGSSTKDEGPDPLIALADAARADIALIAAVVVAQPDLAQRLAPLRAARTEHAAALDGEVARLAAGATATPAPAPAAAPTGAATQATLQASVLAAGKAAAAAVLALPAERVGLVASVSACCAAYAEVLA